VVAQSLLEYQMSKRKPATASKHARSPKIAAKAHRANQAVVRSTPPKRHNESKPEAPRVENPAAALQDVGKQAMRNNDSNKGFGFSSVAANVQAYQAKLLEMAQANMQFALEFAQRLATVRSPVEILRVIEEFTSRRTAMFRKHSQEIAELTTWR
jgi:hypothetical protein